MHERPTGADGLPVLPARPRRRAGEQAQGVAEVKRALRDARAHRGMPGAFWCIERARRRTRSAVRRRGSDHLNAAG